VRAAGVMHGYAETEVFAPNVVRAREMIEQGAIGDVISVRAREAHSGPHAPHFWDAEKAGGGALLDMGCHTIEAARYFFGKDVPMTEAFAWGATLSHADKTTGEDNAVALIKFANGGISITESSWSMKGGMELRNEVTGTGGRLVTDSTATPVHGFITNPGGYLMEKADADTGWVYPIPEEARVYGYMQEMRHFVDCFRNGTEPRETFVDGYVVNCALDACYRSMKSGQWEKIELDGALG
jgi:predicted dehydrogenase